MNLAALLFTISKASFELLDVGCQQVEAYSKIGRTHDTYDFILTDLGAKYKFLLNMFSTVVALLHFQTPLT